MRAHRHQSIALPISLSTFNGSPLPSGRPQAPEPGIQSSPLSGPLLEHSSLISRIALHVLATPGDLPFPSTPCSWTPVHVSASSFWDTFFLLQDSALCYWSRVHSLTSQPRIHCSCPPHADLQQSPSHLQSIVRSATYTSASVTDCHNNAA